MLVLQEEIPVFEFKPEDPCQGSRKNMAGHDYGFSFFIDSQIDIRKAQDGIANLFKQGNFPIGNKLTCKWCHRSTF